MPILTKIEELLRVGNSAGDEIKDGPRRMNIVIANRDERGLIKVRASVDFSNICALPMNTVWRESNSKNRKKETSISR